MTLATKEAAEPWSCWHNGIALPAVEKPVKVKESNGVAETARKDKVSSEGSTWGCQLRKMILETTSSTKLTFCVVLPLRKHLFPVKKRSKTQTEILPCKLRSYWIFCCVYREHTEIIFFLFLFFCFSCIAIEYFIHGVGVP